MINLKNLEQTCVLIKPDAMKKGYAGEIISRFEKNEMRIVGCKLMQLDDLRVFMKSAPVLAMVFEGQNAVERVRTLSGKNFSDTGTIRGDFAVDYRENAIHSSDSTENATAEIFRFFDEGELF